MKNLFSYKKRGKKILTILTILTFDNIEIEKNKLYCHKTPIFWEM